MLSVCTCRPRASHRQSTPRRSGWRRRKCVSRCAPHASVAETESMATVYPAARNLCAAATYEGRARTGRRNTKIRGSNLFAMLFALGRFNRAGLRTKGGGGRKPRRRQGQLGTGRRARAPRQEGARDESRDLCGGSTAVVACVHAPRNVGERKQSVAHNTYNSHWVWRGIDF